MDWEAVTRNIVIVWTLWGHLDKNGYDVSSCCDVTDHCPLFGLSLGGHDSAAHAEMDLEGTWCNGGMTRQNSIWTHGYGLKILVKQWPRFESTQTFIIWWTDQAWCLNTLEYDYATRQRNIQREIMMTNETSQKQKHKYHMISPTCKLYGTSLIDGCQAVVRDEQITLEFCCTEVNVSDIYILCLKNLDFPVFNHRKLFTFEGDSHV